MPSKPQAESQPDAVPVARVREVIERRIAKAKAAAQSFAPSNPQKGRAAARAVELENVLKELLSQ